MVFTNPLRRRWRYGGRGNLHSLVNERTIFTGLSKAFEKNDEAAFEVVRTEQDLPLDKVLIVCGILVCLTFLYYWWATGSLILALAGALFLGVVSFFFAAVAGYIAGVVGSSNSPVSGMTNCNFIIHSCTGMGCRGLIS